MKSYAESAWPALPKMPVYSKKEMYYWSHITKYNSFIHFSGVGLKFYPAFVYTALSWGRAHAPLMTKNQKEVFDLSSKIWDCLICLSTCLLPCAELHPIMAEWAMSGP